MDVINIKTEKRAIHKFEKSKRYIEDRIKLKIPFRQQQQLHAAGAAAILIVL